MSGEKTKLTKTFVDSVPLSPNYAKFYRDSELLGFALRVLSSKVYIVERRIHGKSSVRVTIGKHGNITVAQAREQARFLLDQMSQGINPNKEKLHKKQKQQENYDIAKQQPSLQNAYNAYQSERRLGEKTLKDYEQCMNDYLGDWKNIRLIDITQKMIQEKHGELTQRSKSRANLAMRFLRAIFNFATQHYLDVNDKSILDIKNPVSTLTAKKSWNTVKCRKNYIREDQLADWVKVVLSTQWVGQNYYNCNAYTNQDFILTVLLTGFRREETEKLEWKHVDLKYKTITSINPKNGKPITLPMGEILTYIMQSRYNRSAGKPYVFQARQGEGHITNRSKARLKIVEESGIEFTYHDLRRTFSSLANSINVGSDTIKRLINHTSEDDSKDGTDGNTQVSFEEMYDAMCKIENLIFTDEAKLAIKNRTFDTPSRHQAYFEKSIMENTNYIHGISKIEQLKELMSQPKEVKKTSL
ncbi:tyrosine-type recombinase/integrase [Acinetobacter sp. ANC 5502]